MEDEADENQAEDTGDRDLVHSANRKLDPGISLPALFDGGARRRMTRSPWNFVAAS